MLCWSLDSTPRKSTKFPQVTLALVPGCASVEAGHLNKNTLASSRPLLFFFFSPGTRFLIVTVFSYSTASRSLSGAQNDLAADSLAVPSLNSKVYC